jgi:outer membrane protein
MIQNVQSLRDDFPLEVPSPAAVEPWVESAADRNLILRARTEAVEVARLEVERQRAGHYPTINLLLSRNQKDAGSTLFGGGSNVVTTDTILRLTVPIFEGGMTSAVTEEAAHRYQKAQEDAELERRVVERATRAAFDGALNGVNLVQALKQSVVAQVSALEAKSEGYKAGLNTLLPVLDAQRDLYLARRDYAQSRYEYLISRLKLKQAAGTLSETDLVGIGAALK